MQNYILSKSIEDDKTNNIKDLKEVSKAAWGFISAFYKSHWDSLMVDGTNRSFRNNVKLKFSPQANKELSTPKDKNTGNSSYISSLSPPIPVKSAKCYEHSDTNNFTFLFLLFSWKDDEEGT